jgi:CRP-like cAMP-binding protein
MLLATNARQRVASFLLEMSERLSQPAILDVAVSRRDIADYLGLTVETVSRVLAEFDRAEREPRRSGTVPLGRKRLLIVQF